MMCIRTEGQEKGREGGKKDLFQIHRDNDYMPLLGIIRESYIWVVRALGPMAELGKGSNISGSVRDVNNGSSEDSRDGPRPRGEPQFIAAAKYSLGQKRVNDMKAHGRLLDLESLALCFISLNAQSCNRLSKITPGNVPRGHRNGRTDDTTPVNSLDFQPSYLARRPLGLITQGPCSHRCDQQLRSGTLGS